MDLLVCEYPIYLDQAILALGTTSRRRNQDYAFWIAVCIVVTKIDGKRSACNDL